MMIFFVGKNQDNASELGQIPSSPAPPPSIPKEAGGRTTQALLPRHYLKGLPGGTTHLLGTTTGTTTH